MQEISYDREGDSMYSQDNTKRPSPLNLEKDDIAELSLQFERQSGIFSDEIAVPITPTYTSYKKLEVVSSKTVNFIAKIYNTVTIVSLLLSMIVTILARSNFSITLEYLGKRVTFYEFPLYFDVIDAILSILTFVYISILILSYTMVIVCFNQRCNVLNEQIWVLVLLFFTLFYLLPSDGIFRLLKVVKQMDLPSVNDGSPYMYVLITMRITSFTIIYILYPWLGAHSYRLLGTRITWNNINFYLPKILFCLIYIVYKLVMLFAFQIVFSEVPFMSLIAFIRLYTALSMWPILGIASVLALTGLELFIAIMVGRCIFESLKTLENADYKKHRTSILGFRFFLHQHLIFNIIYLSVYVILLFGFPIGTQVVQYTLVQVVGYYKAGEGSYFDVLYAPFGLNLCLLAFVTVEAFTNLPADFKMNNIFRKDIPQKGHKSHPHNPFSVDENEIPAQPVVYRNREPPSLPNDDSLHVIPNCFVMQTNIQLFNLSWFVYYYGTPKEQEFPLKLGSQGLKIRECFYDEATDTKAIVAESADRIIIAFKGTTSTQNLVTDLKVNQRSLLNVIPIPEKYQNVSNDGMLITNPEVDISKIIAVSDKPLRENIISKPNQKTYKRAQDQENKGCEVDKIDTKANKRSTIIEDLTFTRDLNGSSGSKFEASLKKAKVHSGFANAYCSIREQIIEVSKILLNEKKRPICFAGHSLGGALATLSSLDVKLSLGIGSDRLIVSSFGSPRVGNRSFQQLYDENVLNHWRFVAGGDLISRLPKIGYVHVGKKVILTATGELFIDPSALEIIFWHSQSASIIHHRKACYLLALKAWCDSRGGYVPNIWPFPVTENDTKKFDSTFKKQSSLSTSRASSVLLHRSKKSSLKSPIIDSNRASRMQRYADQIDALQDVNLQSTRKNSIALWENLVGMALEKTGANNFF